MFELGVVLRILAKCLPEGSQRRLIEFAKQALRSREDARFRQRMFAVLIAGGVIGMCLGFTQHNDSNALFGAILTVVGIFTVLYVDTFAELIVPPRPVAAVKVVLILCTRPSVPVGFAANILRPPIY